MARPKVFVFAPIKESLEWQEAFEAAGLDLVLGKADWHDPQGNNEDEMVEMAKGAVAMMGTSIRSCPITKKIMQAAGDDLRIVAKCTIGVDDVDLKGASQLGVLVTHAPTESNWGGVAEGTIAMMLTLMKKARERDEYVKAGNWRNPDLQGLYLGSREMDDYPGLTVGIVGLGRIGGRVSKLLTPWGCRMIGHDPYIPDSRFEELGVEKVSYDKLLAESDIITFHVTLTPETRQMFDAKAVAKCKDGVILINDSRGQVVSEQALCDALDSGKVAQAALDVFEDEPLSKESRLLKMGHKVLLSPHMVSSNLASGLHPGLIWATKCVLNALKGVTPDAVFNKDVIPVWEQRYKSKAIIA
ncbi:MAG: NAD(P)-dependent oxidoreductase [Alphaproteobacteria bacterium]